MDDSSLNRILDDFERESFLSPTFIASGHGTVADVIAGMPEIKTLLEQRNASAPFMVARYRERDSTMSDHERLAYFVVFGLMSRREMTHDIAAYLRRCGRTPHSTLAWPWHPYFYGVRALESFTGGEVQAPAGKVSAKDVGRFIAAVEKWEQTHVQQDVGKHE